MSIPSWPPSLSEAQIHALSSLATDYALSHGIVYRPIGTPPSLDSVIHAPFSLLPSPFPRHLFDFAQSLQHSYDLLYVSAAACPAFLTRVVGGSVAKVDAFQQQLWKIHTLLQSQGGCPQKLELGLFRSDYLMHNGEEVKQVEFNTISASFGALCSRVSELHRYLGERTGYYGHLEAESMPKNQALQVLAGGLEAAHQAYKNQQGVSEAIVLFVVQEGERNAFDQRWIEYELQAPVLRQTFAQLQTTAKSMDGKLFVLDQAVGKDKEVSTIYFRAGYGPDDYPTQKEWDLRLRLERSLAIKCPSVAMQLAGAKKVQQVLAEKGEVEAFLDPEKHDIEALRKSFTHLYPLDTSTLGEEAYKLALEHPQRFVLKPQREGGGNNIYRDDILPALEKMDQEDMVSAQGEELIKKREAYILMSLINPPEGVGNLLVKAGGEGAVLASDVVSELGVYGAVLYEGKQIHHHRSGGYLLRTKARSSDEGGVAVGFSVIDSPYLV